MLQIIPDTAQLKSKVVVVQFDLLKCEHIGEIHYLAIEASRQCAIGMCNTTQILLREYYTNTAHCALKTLFRGSGASTSRTGLFVLSTRVSQNPGSGCIRYVCLYHMVAVCSTELPDTFNKMYIVQCSMNLL